MIIATTILIVIPSLLVSSFCKTDADMQQLELVSSVTAAVKPVHNVVA